MAKILYIKCGGTDILNLHYQRVLEAASRPETEIEVTHLWRLPQGKTALLPDSPVYQGELFRVVKEAEDNGYDGIIIGCTADPGLFEAKRLCKIPVTAPLEANLHLAAIMGTRVTIFIPAGPDARIRYYDLARFYGLKHLINSICLVDVGYPSEEEMAIQLNCNPQELLNAILECHRASLFREVLPAAEKAIKEEGSDVIFCGCTLWAGMLKPMAEQLKVPFLDPVIGSLRYLESLFPA